MTVKRLYTKPSIASLDQYDGHDWELAAFRWAHIQLWARAVKVTYKHQPCASCGTVSGQPHDPECDYHLGNVHGHAHRDRTWRRDHLGETPQPSSPPPADKVAEPGQVQPVVRPGCYAGTDIPPQDGDIVEWISNGERSNTSCFQQRSWMAGDDRQTPAHPEGDTMNIWPKRRSKKPGLDEVQELLKKPWIRGWVKLKPLPAETADGMQIFRSAISCSPETATEYAITRMKAECKKVHIRSLLRSMVLGVGNVHMMANGCPVRSMSGFYEQTGRLPTKDDEVHIKALAWFIQSQGIEDVGDPSEPIEMFVVRYLSECKIKVVK